VLVEVGSRCHGAEGFWMPVSDSVYGYNQVECAIDSYESAAAFSKVPENPLKRLSWGYLLFFVMYKDGIFQGVNKDLMEEITSMKSYLQSEVFFTLGEAVRKTTDCTSWGGVVSLAHADRDTLISDVTRLREMEKPDALFIIE
jgi:hypothetical protein